MDTIYIDINCDVGEGIGNETELMPLISSCNIACGGHLGNLETISEVARLANKYGVKVGAHPSYPDQENFGRVSMDISELNLIQSIQGQIEDFESVLKKENIPFHHIKAHGALYNDISKDPLLAKIFLKSIQRWKGVALIYVPFESVIEQEAIKNGFQVKQEAFADRNYNSDLSLVSRKLPEAIIDNPEEVLAHLLFMIKKGLVVTPGGFKIDIQAQTYCVHGDTPTALGILNYLSEELPKRNIHIKK